MTTLATVPGPGDPDPAHNVDAFRAAREWAAEHVHPQPDDRMLKAYGRVLLAALHEPANDIEATGRCCCAGCAGMGPCDRADGTKPSRD